MVRVYATLAQALVLCSMFVVLIGGLATQASPPIDLPGWRTATPQESLIHQLEQRRALEDATRP